MVSIHLFFYCLISQHLEALSSSKNFMNSISLLFREYFQWSSDPSLILIFIWGLQYGSFILSCFQLSSRFDSWNQILGWFNTSSIVMMVVSRELYLNVDVLNGIPLVTLETGLPCYSIPRSLIWHPSWKYDSDQRSHEFLSPI